ncbi:AAA family ATPase [Paenibacillus daejeonensis]|uniref:AAA family ATPase n=1 Tax=Paenibacillus daejeonensis TaxID=135193 RepID=UPI0003A20200|nr:AAA family ATPase [Paenibacillus daejeonensis]
MRKIILERLTLRNFKGFRELVITTGASDLDVYGDNATGKTTIFDAFTWLLFGKDSANRTEQSFEIKELDESGNVRQHKLEHEVEGLLSIDGRQKTFRRVYAEKWVKKRGSIKATYDGHETTYHLDGVPVKKGEYEAQVTAIIPEERFKLITSPTYFNEALKKDDRRRILMEICGEIPDAEILHSKKELRPLEKILQERSVEDHKKIVTAALKRINGEIGDIPIRISEVQRSMPDVSELSEELLQEDIASLRGQVTERQLELMAVQSGGRVMELKNQWQHIDGQMIDIKRRLQSDVLEEIAKQRDHVASMHRRVDELRRSIDDREYKIKTGEQRIAALDAERSQMAEQFAAAKAEPFEHTNDDNCSACGQLLPEADRDKAHAAALAEFNRRKSEKLTGIKSRGHAVKEEAERLRADVTRYRSELQAFRDQLQLQEQAKAADAELERLRGGVQDPSKDPEYRKLSTEADRIAAQIKELRESTQQEQHRIQGVIDNLQVEIRTYEADLAKFEQANRQQNRIDELEVQEGNLAAEYERQQHELFLTEEFIRTKVSLLQSRIDSKFRLARFRLFEEQINGGIKEVCDTLYKGVPYDGGLNKAAQNNVGIDIINTLCEHYGVTAPIFVDNAESVTKLQPTDSQVVRLIVSEDDKKLRFKSNH